MKQLTPFDAKKCQEIREKYDLGKVCRHLLRDNVDVGYEREISHELRNHCSMNSDHGGLVVPYTVLCRGMTLGKHPVAGSVADGSALIATDLLANEYINPLEARLVTTRAGARFVDNLVGDIAIPKGSNVSAYWIDSETGEATKVNPTFAQVLGSPHTVGAYVDISRQLMIQSCLPAQNLISELISRAISRAVDTAALDGTGNNGQPTGICRTTGVKSITGITADKPTKQNLLDFIAALDDANVDTDNLKWVATSKVKAKLAATIDAQLVKNAAGTDNVGAVTSARYLCEKNAIEDYPLITSNLAPAKKLILGAWDNLIIAGWGAGIELVANPYTLSTSGTMRIVALKEVDVLVRHAEAFAQGTILA